MQQSECWIYPFWLKKKNTTFNAFCKRKAIIIADKSLSKEEQLIIVDQCLEFNYNVLRYL
jgi:hypothetical protein